MKAVCGQDHNYVDAIKLILTFRCMFYDLTFLCQNLVKIILMKPVSLLDSHSAWILAFDVVCAADCISQIVGSVMYQRNTLC